jgi:putative aldouronate transport system permease protein
MNLAKHVKRDRYLLFLVLPALVYYVVFHYIPIYGTLMAFVDYLPGSRILANRWVGLHWFALFFRSIYFVRLLRNTVVLSGLTILFSFPLPILFALALNEVRFVGFKKVMQTISYMPHFVSVVVIVGIVFNMLSVSSGVVNSLLERAGLARIDFMNDPRWFRTVYTGLIVWQTYGWNSIIYLAAIASIDPAMYEAARMDGAGRLQQIVHITVPSLAPVMVIVLILMLGRAMSVGFEQVILMYSPATYETADVVSTYVYRRGIVGAQFSFGAAVGLFNSVVNFAILLAANAASRRAAQTSLW